MDHKHIDTDSQLEQKLFALPDLTSLIAERRSQSARIVLANGVFDVLHVGHLRYLRGAAELGDVLVVAVNDDESTRAYKGEGRPVTTLSERLELLAALDCVDYLVSFGQAQVTGVIDALQPDVHAKGTDYTTETVPERAAVLAYGGEIAITGDPKDHNATEIIARMKSLSAGDAHAVGEAFGEKRPGGERSDERGEQATSTTAEPPRQPAAGAPQGEPATNVTASAQGNPVADFLVDKRIFVTSILVAVFLLTVKPTVTGFWLGLPFALAGLATRTWASGYIFKTKKLATVGPYAYVRNPLYVGSFLIGIGGAIIGNSSIFMALFLIGFGMVYSEKVRREENHLRKLFGEEYQRFLLAVPRFMPRFTPADIGAEGEAEYSWQQTLGKHQEWRLWAAVGACLVILYVIASR